MEFSIYERLIRECARYPEVQQVHLHGFGEPLLDKSLPQKVRMAKDLGIPYTYIVTTGFLLSERLASELVLAGLDGIKFSFYGMSKATYESVHRNLNFDRTVANIERFLRVRDEHGSATPSVRFQFNCELAPMEEMRAFCDHWSSWMDLDRGDVFLVTGLHNWAGGKQCRNFQADESERHCSWPFREVQILWDGRVAPCCFDYDGSLIFGDVSEASIRSVWRSPKYEQFRETWRSKKSLRIPLCAKCDNPEGEWVAHHPGIPCEIRCRAIVNRSSLKWRLAKRRMSSLYREVRVALANR